MEFDLQDSAGVKNFPRFFKFIIPFNKVTLTFQKSKYLLILKQVVYSRQPKNFISLCRNKLGMKAHDTAELFFEDVRLPKTSILGGENTGFYHLMTELPQERLQIGVAG